jgi:hypothetical protein
MGAPNVVLREREIERARETGVYCERERGDVRWVIVVG